MATNSITSADAAKELLARRRARTSLLHFTMYTNPDYRANWHHELLCSKLDQFVSGDIKRLIVSMPPRHGKSELISRRLPAYILGRNPDEKIIATSYGADLASTFNRDVQRIIDSPEYARLFPETKLFGKNIRTVANGSWMRNSDMFEIVNHKGYYRNAGVGGAITGKGFGYGFIDDPFKDAKEANSPTIRERVAEWYYSTFYTRQQKGASICIVMTRWHMDDLVGRLLDAMSQIDGEQWELLELPAVMYDVENKHPDDPRDYNEALWESDYPRSFLSKVEVQNKYVFSALYQQSPIPMGEGLFDTAKIEIVEPSQVPDTLRKVRFYDLAVSAKTTADYSVGVLMGLDTSTQDIYLLDVYRRQTNPTSVYDDIRQNAQIDGNSVPIYLEAENSARVQLDHMLRDATLRQYALNLVKPDGDKYTRATPFASRVNNGKVKMLRGAWNRAYLDEFAVFPMGKNDDQVDASSGAYGQLDNTVEYFFLH